MYETWQACTEAIRAQSPTIAVGISDPGNAALPIGDLDLRSSTVEWLESEPHLFYCFHWYGTPNTPTAAVDNAVKLASKWGMPALLTEFGGYGESRDKTPPPSSQAHQNHHHHDCYQKITTFSQAARMVATRRTQRPRLVLAVRTGTTRTTAGPSTALMAHLTATALYRRATAGAHASRAGAAATIASRASRPSGYQRSVKILGIT